jgi:hypothetical protein
MKKMAETRGHGSDTSATPSCSFAGFDGEKERLRFKRYDVLHKGSREVEVDGRRNVM